MSKEDVRKQLESGTGLIILQKIHLILMILGIIVVVVTSIAYSKFRLDKVEDDIKELKVKTEMIQEMRSDIKHINEGIQDIKLWQLRQEESIKEFYKNYKLDKK